MSHAVDSGATTTESQTAALAASEPEHATASSESGLVPRALAAAKSFAAGVVSTGVAVAGAIDKRVPHIRGRPALSELYNNLKPGITVALVSLCVHEHSAAAMAVSVAAVCNMPSWVRTAEEGTRT